MNKITFGTRVRILPLDDWGVVVDKLWDEDDNEIPEGHAAVQVDNGQGTWGFPREYLRPCPAGSDRLGNLVAREGHDRCDCGAKYWEFDHCVDCGSSLTRSGARG